MSFDDDYHEDDHDDDDDDDDDDEDDDDDDDDELETLSPLHSAGALHSLQCVQKKRGNFNKRSLGMWPGGKEDMERWGSVSWEMLLSW